MCISRLSITMNILLVRNPSEDTPDRYHQHLLSIGLHPHSIPVLETVYTNLGDLRAIVKGKSSGCGGVIMTSSRSAEAWDLIRGELSSTQRDDSGDSGKYSYVAMWARRELPI